MIPPGRSADYGIFDSIQRLDREEAERGGDPEVLAEIGTRFGSILPVDRTFGEMGTAGFQEEQLSIPGPITRSPVVFEALSRDPMINNTNILDWILPPPLSDQGGLNYLVLVKYGEREVWGLGSMIPRIGIMVDSSLDKWVYLDVDGEASTGDENGHDIRTRLTFARDLLARDWDVSLIPPKLTFNNAGVKFEIEALDVREGSSELGGSVFFIKGISYGGIIGDSKNYIWSVGFDLEKFADTMRVMVQASKWVGDPVTAAITAILSGGSVDIRDLGILEVLGPYTISYTFGTAPREVSISISVMRVFDQVLEDRAYLNLMISHDRSHERIIGTGKLTLDIEDIGSPIDRVQWQAGSGEPDDTVSLGIRYAEFGADLIDAEIQLPVLPCRLTLNITYAEDSEKDRTVVEVITPDGIGELWFREAIYRDWGSTGSFDDMEATEVAVRDIPGRLRIETTASVPETEDGGSGMLNIFDSFMSGIAGRFYRIGMLLREIPRAVAEMPGRQGSTMLECFGDRIGSLDYRFSTGPFLNNTGNYVAFFDHGGIAPAISAHLESISHYSGTFRNGTDITLGLEEVRRVRIGALFQQRSAFIDIIDIPSRVHLVSSDDLLSYEGTDGGTPAGIGGIEYRYRDQELFFDVNIYDIPSSLSMKRSRDQLEVMSGEGAIGTLEMFTANSTTVKPIDLPERNFVSVRKENELSAVGLRLNRFRSFTYNNGSAGFIELETQRESNFYAVIEDLDSNLEVTMAFVPLPVRTHIDTPSIVDTPEISIPNLIGIGSISDYSDIILSLSEIGKAPLLLASGISRSLTLAVGKYSTGFSMSWDLSEKGETLDLILNVRKKGDFEIPEALWTHGIWIEQMGTGENGSVDGKIYLDGMPATGSVNLSFSEETITAGMDFKGYSPGFDWFLIRTNGVQDRDISVYITGLIEGMDLSLDMTIFTDLSIGGSMRIDMDVEVKDLDGQQMDLGPTMATLRKSSPILSIRQMYLPKVPSKLRLNAFIGDGITADYQASRSIEHLYFKITKYMDGRWSQVYAIFHDLPLTFNVDLHPTRDFTIQEPFPLQGLPVLTLTASDSDMDIFIEYDGAGFGQRGRYKVYVDDIGNTRTYYSGEDYVIDSEGIGFLSIELDRLPVMESFVLSSLSILGSDLEHLTLSARMGYGIYPLIFIDDAEGGGFQIKVSGEATLKDDTYTPNIYFITLRTRKIAGTSLINGLSVDKDTMVLDIERNDGSVTIPSPLLTFWAWVLGGGG
ncbi:MAG: hypothetical protein JW939_07200 [Candidatus Thermoplasmatota archaeon]|nr:hypothetical protein [Candidatus Thermoplasmatota archaeon]